MLPWTVCLKWLHSPDCKHKEGGASQLGEEDSTPEGRADAGGPTEACVFITKQL